MTLLPTRPPGGALYCIADQSVFAGNRFNSAEKILAWLAATGIIEAKNRIVRHQRNGRRFSDAIFRVLTGSLPDINSEFVGLEYITERRIYCFNCDLDYIICPHCKSDLKDGRENENIFWTAIEKWISNEGADNLTCPRCHKNLPFHEFQYGVECIFSDLAFVFFGCKGLTDEFQAEFERQLGCPVRLLWNFHE